MLLGRGELQQRLEQIDLRRTTVIIADQRMRDQGSVGELAGTIFPTDQRREQTVPLLRADRRWGNGRWYIQERRRFMCYAPNDEQRGGEEHGTPHINYELLTILSLLAYPVYP